MNTALAILGIVASGIVGFFIGKKSGGGAALTVAAAKADATFFQTSPGSDGFVDARILKFRMHGRTFHWNRVGTKPAAGSWFEIRPKSGASVLVPPVPTGVDSIFADVEASVAKGTIYHYALWQVLADGSKKELVDPELEVGEV